MKDKKEKTSKINRDLKKALITSIIITLLLVLGIPLIIIGATKNIWALLGIGIAFTVIGFYGTPLIWVSYANKKSLKHVVEIIVNENLTNVSEISRQLQITDKQTRDFITTAIKKQYITGYIFDGANLTLNQKEAPKRKIAINKCPNCGGTLQQNDNEFICLYCGSHFNNE